MHTDSWLERGITTVVDAQLIVKGYPSKDSLATNTLKTVLDVDIWPKKDSALASLVTRCRSAILGIQPSHWILYSCKNRKCIIYNLIT
jgi:hypothetical protein